MLTNLSKYYKVPPAPAWPAGAQPVPFMCLRHGAHMHLVQDNGVAMAYWQLDAYWYHFIPGPAFCIVDWVPVQVPDWFCLPTGVSV